MITGITIKEDWRCFKAGLVLEFKPMTLLVGDQGCGKSSTMRLLVEGERYKNIFQAHTDEPTNTRFFDFEKDSLRTKSYVDSIADAASRFMSHGEMNLLMLEAALEGVEGPVCLLMDEPDMALSIRSVTRLGKLFKSIVERGHQIIASAHNPFLIGEFDEVLSLEHGEWMDVDEFVEDHLKGDSDG